MKRKRLEHKADKVRRREKKNALNINLNTVTVQLFKLNIKPIYLTREVA